MRVETHVTLTALALLGLAPGTSSEQILVASLVDDIVYADLIPSGSCHTGCTREEHAVAHIEGDPSHQSCELQTVTPFDTTIPDPGLLRASVYCEDSTGALIEEGTRPCVFDICVDFAWTDAEDGEGGQLTYDVLIIRNSKPSGAHTVYVDLSVSIDPSAAYTDVDSCVHEGICATKNCTEPNPYGATISMTDDFGDGWVGGVSGYYNMWNLINLTDDKVVATGTLADNHESATIKECLGNGEYIFNTTATSAFADEMGWSICNTYGGAGEGVRFTVVDGTCDESSAAIIARATAEETDDAADSYCTLPAPDDRTSTCTTLSSGLKIEGVGLYYDERCTRAHYSGCGARSIDACRMCFVDRDEWRLNYPYERMPDWEDCPCCVADVLGVECATGGGGGEPNIEVIIGVTVALVGFIAIACCLSCAFGKTILRFIRRCNKKRAAENELELDPNVASAFPESPTGGGATIRGTVNTQGRGRGNSGHFPIPRFDSIRGRFDSGIFASNNAGAVGAGAHASGSGGVDKIQAADGASVMTAQSTPSALGARGSPTAPRSTVLDERLVMQGLTTSDVGRPHSSHRSSGGGSGGGAAGWGLAMSGEYPDLEGSDPYMIDNAMAEAGTTGRHERGFGE